MTRAWQAAQRLLLLMLLATGVAAMHTVGHLDGHLSSPSHGVHLVHAAETSLSVGAESGHAPSEPATSVWMCLAVLGLGMAWLLRLLFVAVFDFLTAVGSRVRLWPDLGRGPPLPLLTRMVVLRI
ncbi:hypothetical protein [Nonomuraea sp. CA-141351]|uniref:hypothetical protein n=1 Tax=Nonomuraea sp. CA-141351 TaxID=3239996 RepID=UPI003D9238E4